jgi:hypothetical protein
MVASSTLKMAVETPMARASVAMATNANAGERRSWRTAKCRSWVSVERMVFIWGFSVGVGMVRNHPDFWFS